MGCGRANVLLNHVKMPSQIQCRRSFIMFGLSPVSFLSLECLPPRRIPSSYVCWLEFIGLIGVFAKLELLTFSRSLIASPNRCLPLPCSIATIFCRLIDLSSRRRNCARSSSWRSHGPRLADRRAGQKLVIHEHSKKAVGKVIGHISASGS